MSWAECQNDPIDVNFYLQQGHPVCFPDLLMGLFQCENLKNVKGTKMEKESGGEIGSQIHPLRTFGGHFFEAF